MNEKASDRFINFIPLKISTRLLKFLSHLADHPKITNEKTKGMNQKKFSTETLIAQKRALLSYLNDGEGDTLLSLRPTLLDEAKLEEIIKNPLVVTNYWWAHEDLGQLFLEYPIEVACSKGWKEMTLHLIHQNHLLPISRARSLCNAVEKNHHEIVQYLIQAGVSVTECNVQRHSIPKNGNLPLNTGLTVAMCPLYYAIKGNAIESAKLLLEAGASLDDLSFVHPMDKNDQKENHCSVRQSIDAGKLTLSDEMKNVIDEHEKLQHYRQYHKSKF